MSERDEFEAWARGHFPNIQMFDTRYLHNDVQGAWLAWQAARATQAVPTLTGWKLVPLEPSVRMLAQICNLSRSPSMRYAAMLAAAPQPSPEQAAETPPIAKAFERAVYEAGGFPPGAYRTYQD